MFIPQICGNCGKIMGFDTPPLCDTDDDQDESQRQLQTPTTYYSLTCMFICIWVIINIIVIFTHQISNMFIFLFLLLLLLLLRLIIILLRLLLLLLLRLRLLFLRCLYLPYCNILRLTETSSWNLLRSFQLVAAELLLPIFTLGSRTCCCANFNTSRASEKPEQGVAARLTNQWKVQHQHLGSGTIVRYFGQKSCVDRTAVRRASKTKQGHGFTMVHFKIDTSPQTDIYITHAQAHSVALYTLRVLRCFTHSAPYLLPTSYKVRKIWKKNCSVKVFLTSLVKIPQKVCLKLVGQRMTKVGICRYHYGSDHSYGITDLVILEAALNMLCSVSRRV